MLGRVELAADIPLVAPAAFTLIPGLEMSFFVEEDEMLIDLYAKLAVSQTVVGRSDYTLFVDGVDIASGVNGLACITPAVGGDEETVILSRTVRLNQGDHVLSAHAKVAAGNITVEAGTI